MKEPLSTDQLHVREIADFTADGERVITRKYVLLDEYERLQAVLRGIGLKCDKYRAALENAVEVIETWHEMHGTTGVWDIYYRNAPEMRQIREALA